MNYRLWGALMQGEVYRISMQSMWPVIVVHLMGIGRLNSKPPETRDGERRNKNVEKIPNVRRERQTYINYVWWYFDIIIFIEKLRQCLANYPRKKSEKIADAHLFLLVRYTVSIIYYNDIYSI